MAEATPLSRPQRLTCAVCGAYIRGRQWWNRDTGFGLCQACPTWLANRGMDAEEMQRLYGKPGIHYPDPATGKLEGE